MHRVKYNNGKLQVGVKESSGLQDFDIVLVNDEVFTFVNGKLLPIFDNTESLSEGEYDCIVYKDIKEQKRESFLEEYDRQHFISERHAVLWAFDWKFSFDYLKNS